MIKPLKLLNTVLVGATPDNKIKYFNTIDMHGLLMDIKNSKMEINEQLQDENCETLIKKQDSLSDFTYDILCEILLQSSCVFANENIKNKLIDFVCRTYYNAPSELFWHHDVHLECAYSVINERTIDEQYLAQIQAIQLGRIIPQQLITHLQLFRTAKDSQGNDKQYPMDFTEDMIIKVPLNNTSIW